MTPAKTDIVNGWLASKSNEELKRIAFLLIDFGMTAEMVSAVGPETCEERPVVYWSNSGEEIGEDG